MASSTLKPIRSLRSSSDFRNFSHIRPLDQNYFYASLWHSVLELTLVNLSYSATLQIFMNSIYFYPECQAAAFDKKHKKIIKEFTTALKQQNAVNSKNLLHSDDMWSLLKDIFKSVPTDPESYISPIHPLLECVRVHLVEKTDDYDDWPWEVKNPMFTVNLFEQGPDVYLLHPKNKLKLPEFKAPDEALTTDDSSPLAHEKDDSFIDLEEEGDFITNNDLNKDELRPASEDQAISPDVKGVKFGGVDRSGQRAPTLTSTKPVLKKTAEDQTPKLKDPISDPSPGVVYEKVVPQKAQDVTIEKKVVEKTTQESGLTKFSREKLTVETRTDKSGTQSYKVTTTTKTQITTTQMKNDDFSIFNQKEEIKVTPQKPKPEETKITPQKPNPEVTKITPQKAKTEEVKIIQAPPQKAKEPVVTKSAPPKDDEEGLEYPAYCGAPACQKCFREIARTSHFLLNSLCCNKVIVAGKQGIMPRNAVAEEADPKTCYLCGKGAPRASLINCICCFLNFNIWGTKKYVRSDACGILSLNNWVDITVGRDADLVECSFCNDYRNQAYMCYACDNCGDVVCLQCLRKNTFISEGVCNACHSRRNIVPMMPR
ncbi:hypothetical protein SteCoe_9974 [Stentor coeruleus]|uniref:Uncharacterized protein n=1 Tax=Stentor coeruleus TaxID=5963 RepID=A0A1R2CGQ4_9CILI|nr:hypothetical protein SteCoe_9974 [Stentor coeruleus]